MKKGQRKVEITLEQIIETCQEQAERVKELNMNLWEIINNTAKVIEEEGFEDWEKKYEKAKEDYDRAYSQLIGMIDLAQAIFDPDSNDGYFTLEFTNDHNADKVIYRRFEVDNE